jgi:hypothetical protein
MDDFYVKYTFSIASIHYFFDVTLDHAAVVRQKIRTLVQ